MAEYKEWHSEHRMAVREAEQRVVQRFLKSAAEHEKAEDEWCVRVSALHLHHRS